MDPEFLRYYNRELQFIREMGAEFARDYPKIAGRLGMEGFECADPYVERLLEGFAFLAARVQLKLDAEFPSFTQHLLEMVYPHYLAPTPSMAVVQFQPDFTKGDLASGACIPRQSSLRTVLGKGERTACEYRTSADVTLWPIELVDAKPLNTAAAQAAGSKAGTAIKAGISFRFRSRKVSFDHLPLDRLRLFLRGGESLRTRLYEQILGHARTLLLKPGGQEAPWQIELPADNIERAGFDDREALLPYGPQSFQGYRLLREYFAFPDRYLFIDFKGLREAAKRCSGTELELLVLLDQNPGFDEDAFDASYFALYCTPAINLFPKRADRIHLSNRNHEHHVVPDRTRALDFEVFSIQDVVGIGAHTEPEQEFQPFYRSHDRVRPSSQRAYYSLHREPRRPSTQQQQRGPRSSYLGSEVFVSLVDANEAPYRHDLRQLAVGTLCTNRDLPLQVPLGKGMTDFTLEISAPVKSVRCIAGPTQPRPSFPKGDYAWRLISHLSLNYLSLADQSPDQGASALRELLSLYGDLRDPASRRQIEGVSAIGTAPITRRLPDAGRPTFVRGLEVRLTLDPAAFEGSGLFLLGSVLEQFFAKYVSINSFTETVLNTPDQSEVMRWPARIGRRHIS